MSNQLAAVAASPIAKEIASTSRLYVARHLHFVANNKKGLPLPHRLFLK